MKDRQHRTRLTVGGSVGVLLDADCDKLATSAGSWKKVDAEGGEDSQLLAPPASWSRPGIPRGHLEGSATSDLR
jgi:hypothetical protein